MTILRAFLITIAISFIAGITLLGVLTRRDALIADQWIAERIGDILDRYLVPSVRFDAFSMDSRESVTLEGLTLTAPGGERVVEADALHISFGGIPLPGRPLTIRRVKLEGAVVRLIAERAEDEDGRPGRITGLRGLAPFIDTDAVRRPLSVPADLRLPDILRLERLDLTNVSIEFDPSHGDPPLRLANISGAMTIEPDDGDPRWKSVRISLDGGPTLRLAASGAVSIERRAAKIASARVDLQLDDRTIESLPPAVQDALRSTELRGRATAVVAGDVSLSGPEQNALELSATLADFSAASGRVRLPIDEAALSAQLSGLVASFSGRARLLGGGVSIDKGTLSLSDDRPISAAWSAEQLDLSRLMREASGGDSSPLQATLDSTGAAHTLLRWPIARLDSEGRFAIRGEHLDQMPLGARLEASGGRSGTVPNGYLIRGTFGLTKERGSAATLRLESSLMSPQDEELARWAGTILLDARGPEGESDAGVPRLEQDGDAADTAGGR